MFKNKLTNSFVRHIKGDEWFITFIYKLLLEY